ncbi:MAG: SLC13 family permease [Trichlorobacter sp.]|nr:SLC13 family permease [Trichlorobacter sp.]
MYITIITLLIASVFFVTGVLRADLVAICALTVLMLFGILTPAEALSGFSSPIVMMMVGLFIVGGGIFQTGLAKKASNSLLRLSGTGETTLLVTVMVVTALFGTLVSNTGTVAVLMPVVVSLARSANISPGRLLMPMAFASSFGGIMTLIGTPPNLVIHETLIEAGFEPLSFFSFTPSGLVGLLVGIVSILYLRRFLPASSSGSGKSDSSSLDQLVKKYSLSNNLFRVKVRANSTALSKTLGELNIPARFEANIIEIRRKTSATNQFLKTIDQEVARPDTVLEEGDILYVYGTFEHVCELVKAFKLSLLDRQSAESKVEGSTESYASAKIGIAEVMLTPECRLIDKPVAKSGFREKFRLNILGIQRKNKFLLHNLKDEKIRFGDLLLVQGSWHDIALLSADQDNYVVVGQPVEEASKITIDYKAPVAAVIMLMMVVLLVTETVSAVLAIMVAAVLMILLGCVRTMEDAYKTINWESIILIGGMLPMAIAIEKTGASRLLANSLVHSLGDFGPLALLAGVYAATSMLTMFISNTACAVLIAPIALNAAIQYGVSPYPFLFAVSIGASMCFASPFSTPPNALVMSAGRYKFSDYIKVGLPLQVIMGLVMVAVLPLLFPF